MDSFLSPPRSRLVLGEERTAQAEMSIAPLNGSEIGSLPLPLPSPSALSLPSSDFCDFGAATVQGLCRVGVQLPASPWSQRLHPSASLGRCSHWQAGQAAQAPALQAGLPHAGVQGQRRWVKRPELFTHGRRLNAVTAVVQGPAGTGRPTRTLRPTG